MTARASRVLPQRLRKEWLAQRKSGGRPELATGRVLQFDPARGYGFVAADDGGEDVFLHASVFDGDPGVLVPGKKVRFQVMAGDRGRKAFAVNLMTDESDPDDKQTRPVPAAPAGPSIPALQGPAQPAQPVQMPPVQVPPAPSAVSLPAPDDEEQLCDVLSPPEFRQELTELLLNTVPELTGKQISEARMSVLELAKKHGWIDG
jgi:cold shock CspA family protein